MLGGQGFTPLPVSTSFIRGWIKVGVIVVEYQNGTRYKVISGVTPEVVNTLLHETVSVGRIVRSMNPVRCNAGEYQDLV
jgi:hypothetical protein